MPHLRQFKVLAAWSITCVLRVYKVYNMSFYSTKTRCSNNDTTWIDGQWMRRVGWHCGNNRTYPPTATIAFPPSNAFIDCLIHHHNLGFFFCLFYHVTSLFHLHPHPLPHSLPHVLIYSHDTIPIWTHTPCERLRFMSTIPNLRHLKITRFFWEKAPRHWDQACEFMSASPKEPRCSRHSPTTKSTRSLDTL